MLYNFEIKNLKKINHKSIVATFTLSMNDVMDIENCRLVYSEKYDKYTIFMPCTEYTSSKTKKTAYFSLVKLSPSLQDKALAVAVEAYKDAK